MLWDAFAEEEVREGICKVVAVVLKEVIGLVALVDMTTSEGFSVNIAYLNGED